MNKLKVILKLSIILFTAGVGLFWGVKKCEAAISCGSTIVVTGGTEGSPYDFEDVYVACPAEVTKQGAAQYEFLAHLDIGDGSTETWFADTSKSINYPGTGTFIKITGNAHFRLGEVYDEVNRLTRYGCFLTSTGTLQNIIAMYDSCQLELYSTVIDSPGGQLYMDNQGNNSNIHKIWNVIWRGHSPSANNGIAIIDIYNVRMEHSVSGILSLGAQDKITISSGGSYGGFFASAPDGAGVSGYDIYDVTYDFLAIWCPNMDLYIDNTQTTNGENWIIMTQGSTGLDVHRRYSYEPRAINSIGGGVGELSLKIRDKLGALVVDVESNPEGYFGRDYGTAESGTITTLTDTDKSWTIDEWKKAKVKITSGTGAGQERPIVGNTATALTVGVDWDTNPDATSKYYIFPLWLEHGHFDNVVTESNTTPHHISIKKYGKKSVSSVKFVKEKITESVIVEDDPFVTLSESAAGALTGITYTAPTKVTFPNESHTDYTTTGTLDHFPVVQSEFFAVYGYDGTDDGQYLSRVTGTPDANGEFSINYETGVLTFYNNQPGHTVNPVYSYGGSIVLDNDIGSANELTLSEIYDYMQAQYADVFTTVDGIAYDCFVDFQIGDASTAGSINDSTKLLSMADGFGYSFGAAGGYLDLYGITGSSGGGGTTAQEVWEYSNRTLTDVSNIASGVWGYSGRTLTSFGTLVADIWGHSDRTLTSFGTLVSDIADAVWSYGTRTLTSGGGGATPQEIWEYSNRGLTTFGTLVSDIWNNATRQLTSRYTDEVSPVDLAQVADISSLATSIELSTTETNLTSEIDENQALIEALNSITAADVWSYANRSITDPDIIWEYALTDIGEAGSIGQLLKDNIDASITSRSSHTAADVWGVVTRTLTSNENFNDPTSAQNAQAVWEYATRTLTDQGNDITAAEVWEVMSNTLTTEGTIGKQLADNCDVTISSRASQASIDALNNISAVDVWSYATRGLTEEVDLTTVSTDEIWEYALTEIGEAGSIGRLLKDNIDASITSRSSHTAADVWGVVTRTLTSNENFNDPTSAQNAQAVWEYATRTLTDQGNDITAAEVWEVMSDTLTTDGTIGKQLADNCDVAISTRSTLTAADVWSYSGRTLDNFGTLVADIWAYATRGLTTREIGPDEHIAKEETLVGGLTGGLTIETHTVSQFFQDQEGAAVVMVKYNGVPVSGATVTADYYKPDDTVFLSNQAFTEIGSTGTYRDNFNIPADADEGVYKIVAQASHTTSGSNYTDDFEDGNDDGWANTGATWVVEDDGAPQSYVYKKTDYGGAYFAYSTAAGDQENFIYEAKVRIDSPPGSNSLGLAFRYIDSSNTYNFYLRRPGSGPDGTVRLMKGTATLQDSDPFAINLDQWYTLKVVVDGGHILGYVDDVLRVDYTDPSPLSAAKIGFFSYNTKGSHDDVIVTPVGTTNTAHIAKDFKVEAHSEYQADVSNLATSNEVANVQTTVDSIETKVDSLHTKVDTIGTNVDTIITKWDTHTAEEIIGDIDDIEGALGDNLDTCAADDTIFGNVQCVQDKWGTQTADAIYTAANNAYNTIGFVRSELDYNGKTTTAYEDMQTLRGYVDTLESSIGTSSDTAETATVFGRIKKVQDKIDELENVDVDLTEILDKWGSYDAEDIYDKVKDITTGVADINMISNISSLLDLELVDTEDIDGLKNYIIATKAVVDINRMFLEQLANQPLIKTWLEEGSVVFKTMITNPSDVAVQTAILKYYLPREVQEEDIIKVDEELIVDYDAVKEALYIYGEFELEPDETRTYSVEVADIWKISEEEVESLRNQTRELFEPLKGTNYFAQGATIKSDIDVALNRVLRLQKEAYTPEARINAYREAINELEGVRIKIEDMKTLVASAGSIGTMFGFIGGVQTLAGWGLIIVLIGGFVFLALYIRTLRLRDKQIGEKGKEAAATSDPAEVVENPKRIVFKIKGKSFFIIGLVILLLIGAAIVGAKVFGYFENRRVEQYQSTPEQEQEETLSDSSTEQDQAEEPLSDSDPADSQTFTPIEKRVRVLENSVGFLNVRECSGRDCKKITQVSVGEKFVELERQENDVGEEWIKIRVDDETVGWVLGTYVETIESEGSQTSEDVQLNEEDQVLGRTSMGRVEVIVPYGVNGVNIREQPSLNSKILTIFGAKKEVNKIGETEGWVKIEIEVEKYGVTYSEGWVSKKLVQEIE